MDAIRKKFAPKKEVPRKIQISVPSLTPAVVFGPGKIVRYAEPENPEDDEPWKTDPFVIPPHPNYAERKNHPGRLERTDKGRWKKALKDKNFEVVPPADPTTTFQHGFTYSDPYQFCEEQQEPPRPAPTYEEQLKRYPPTHKADGTPIFPPPAPSTYVPYNVQQALDHMAVTDKKVARKQQEREQIELYRAWKEEYRRQEEQERADKENEDMRNRFEARWGPMLPMDPPTPPPKDTRSRLPPLGDVLRKFEYEDFPPEQQKDLLPPPVFTGRHADLKEKLAKTKATKAAKGRQPLENGFVNNSVSTPVAGPSKWQPGDDEEAIKLPPKTSRGGHIRSASVSQKSPVHSSPGTPEKLSTFKFGSSSRAKEGSSSRRADVENSVSTPAIDYSKEPLPAVPRQPRPVDATHGRTRSRNAVYYTPEDMQHAAFMGSSSTRPRNQSMDSATPSRPQPQSQQQQQTAPAPAPVPSSSHVRSDSTSSTKRHGAIGYPPTPPLRIHKRNPSSSSDMSQSQHSVLDYAMATTSGAGLRPQGPPPVMRHRELIDTNHSVIKRPGRKDSLPINTRSKNAKEEYFTPPPARVVVDPIDGSRTRLSDEELGFIPRRNLSTSAATAPSRLKGASSHGHSQSLQINTEKGLPAHPAVHLQEKKIRRTKLSNN